MEFYTEIEKYGDNVAVVSEDTSISYSYLIEKADDFFALIKDRCLIFILCGNNIESIISYIGCLRNKVVPVLLKNTIDKNSLENLIQLYNPSFIFKPVGIMVDGESVFNFLGYNLVKTGFSKNDNIYDELAVLIPTSGSTGCPKMVRLSYNNLNSNTKSIIEYLDITERERPITSLPMGYVYGLSVIQSHLGVGATIILTSKSFSTKEFWELFKKEKVTSIAGVPYMYEFLKKIKFFNMELPSLRTMTQAGGKLHSSIVREFGKYSIERGIKFFIMYGQTEATARMTYLPPSLILDKSDSIGVAIPGGKIQIINENGEEILDACVDGEIVYEGPNVMLGYAEKKEDLSLGDANCGILLTGDIGRRDDDGFFYVVGRKKRFLKIYGNRISLDEINKILQDNGVGDVISGGEDDAITLFTTDKSKDKTIIYLLSKKTGLHPSTFTIKYIKEFPYDASGKILFDKLDDL